MTLPLSLTEVRKQTHTEVILFPYTHKKVARIIWDVKYKNDGELRTILFSRIGAPLYEVLKKHTLPRQELFIISIPKSSYDPVKKRDFDHGALLAQELKNSLSENGSNTGMILKPIVLEGYLVKNKQERQAAQQSRHARIESMKGSITPTQKLLMKEKTDAPLCIIDDVTTTGATRDEMIRVLKKYFTGKIVFIALAH